MRRAPRPTSHDLAVASMALLWLAEQSDHNDPERAEIAHVRWRLHRAINPTIPADTHTDAGRPARSRPA